MDYTKQLLKAIINRLKSIPAITTLVSERIYTHIPQNTIYPYIRISTSARPVHTLDTSSYTYTLRMQAFDQMTSSLTVLDIRQALLEGLHRQAGNLSLDQGIITGIQQSGPLDCLLEDDGKTWQSIIEFTVLIE